MVGLAGGRFVDQKISRAHAVPTIVLECIEPTLVDNVTKDGWRLVVEIIASDLEHCKPIWTVKAREEQSSVGDAL